MSYIQRALKTFILISLFAVSLSAYNPAHAQTIIRDTEIENAFREWMTPLLKASDLGPQSVRLILVESDQVNAFVAGGANIFIYTGLINKSKTPDEIIGVLAHELGHIVGGHLIGARSALERASFESILGTVLGLGAALVSGNGQVGQAIISGTNNVVQRKFLAHSRVNESSADQAALRFLENAEINPRGLESFLRSLESDDLLPKSQQSEYVRTHPITGNRIEALQTKIKNSPYDGQPLPARWVEQHVRMKAKLLGYIDPGRVVWTYNDSDLSIPAIYARCVAAYRESKYDEALKYMGQLLEKEPANPYFQELKAQILLNYGRVEEAIPYYKQAVETAPRSSLIRIDLGKALLQRDRSEETIREALQVLNRALVDEPKSTRVYRLLATAYGKIGQESMAKLHLAEEAILQRRLPYAKSLVQGVQGDFEENSKYWLRAKDILAHIENLEGKSK